MSRLADFPFETVRLACRKCPRKGQYRKATLLDRYGADQNTVELRLILAADCPKVIANKITDLCGVIYSGKSEAEVTPKPVDWSAKLTRPLTLKDGQKLMTLEDARREVVAQMTIDVEDHALSNAMRLLLKAAQTGSSADREAATEQVENVSRWRAVY
jgi:hypothetical protein